MMCYDCVAVEWFHNRFIRVPQEPNRPQSRPSVQVRMLSREDAKYNFLTFQVYSWIHYLPFKFDRKAGRIELQSIWRRRIFYANYVLAVLYYLNFTRTLVQSLFSKTKVPFNHFSVHTCVTLGLSTEIFRITSFLFAPHEIVRVFNETFLKSAAG